MIDTNQFKRSVKEWFRNNPNGTVEQLTEFCEDQIPAPAFQSYGWLIEQTVGWYSYVLEQRERDRNGLDEEE